MARAVGLAGRIGRGNGEPPIELAEVVREITDRRVDGAGLVWGDWDDSDNDGGVCNRCGWTNWATASPRGSGEVAFAPLSKRGPAARTWPYLPNRCLDEAGDWKGRRTAIHPCR